MPLAGGVPLGLVLGGGGGGFCSGAPPGCVLGALAGGGVCSLDDEGVLGAAFSLGLFEPCEQAPAESASAATHSNNRLRFIGSPLWIDWPKVACGALRGRITALRHAFGPTAAVQNRSGDLVGQPGGLGPLNDLLSHCASQAAFRLRPGGPATSAGYFLAAARFFFLAGSLARDLPKEPR